MIKDIINYEGPIDGAIFMVKQATRASATAALLILSSSFRITPERLREGNGISMMGI
ncbi:MAG: hypothetical protein KIG79_02250 [Bacilli bacterium]|nr:hypothetical protein [Bacilli bacterium]